MSFLQAPNWSTAARGVWGKTNPMTGEWLPLVQHLEDSARVMQRLWEKLPTRTRSIFVDTFLSDDSAGSFLMFLAGVHDVGKATTFQLKAINGLSEVPLPDFQQQLAREGVVFGAAPDRTVRHGAAGQLTLTKWLVDKHGWSKRRTATIACIVGGHHGSNPTDDELAGLGQESRRWDSPSLESVRFEILDRMADFTDATAHLSTWSKLRIPASVQILAEALVIESDWIASNAELFPLVLGEDGNERTAAGLEALNLPQPWIVPTFDGNSAGLFSARFPGLAGATPNAMQAAMVDAAQTMSQPGLILLEAPMGSGKTEAALMAAEVLASRFGCEGVFIGLPTMATSNPMLTRTRSWLEKIPTGTPSTINLAHSKAALNPEFQEIMTSSRLSNLHDESSPIRESRTVVHEWMSGRKKALLAQTVVGTIDQLLFAGLKSKHLALRHLGLAGKVVIVDECHAADHFMRVYLKRVLDWLASYGTPVILMSATLPPAQRAELAQAYLNGLGAAAPLVLEETGYPRLTVVDAGVREIAPEPEDATTVMDLRLLPNERSVVEELRGALAGGGCAAVIRNTVAASQEIYEEVTAAMPDTEVVLFHSRFLAPHRMSKEADLVSRLGRSGDRPKKMVVVGTQVLEQSLDVDFDFMVTDVAPVDLLMQRLGRLHRHPRPDRPEALRTPRCLLIGIDASTVPPTFEVGTKAIYGEASLLRTTAILFGDGNDSLSVAIPGDISDLVTDAYSPSVQVPADWQPAFDAATAKEEQARQESVRQADSFCIAAARRVGDLNGFDSGRASEPDDPRGQARVRDSEDSMEVIVLTRDAYGTVRIPQGVGDHGGRVVPEQLANCPHDNELARAMASCTVPLPRALSGTWIVDAVIEALERGHDVSGWQDSPWLRGQLVLFLEERPDSDLLSTELRLTVRRDGVPQELVRAVSYGSDIGLQVEKSQQ